MRRHICCIALGFLGASELSLLLSQLRSSARCQEPCPDMTSRVPQLFNLRLPTIVAYSR